MQLGHPHGLLRFATVSTSQQGLSCPLESPLTDIAPARPTRWGDWLSVWGDANCAVPLKNWSPRFADPRLTTWLCRPEGVAGRRLIAQPAPERQVPDTPGSRRDSAPGAEEGALSHLRRSALVQSVTTASGAPPSMPATITTKCWPSGATSYEWTLSRWNAWNRGRDRKSVV